MKEEIEYFYDYLQRLLRVDNLSIPSGGYDLVLDIMVTDDSDDDKRISWSYYYACHEARCLFWLETYDASYMISELYGVKSPAHVSTLHLSHPEFLVMSTNVACRAPFGVPLLVGLSSLTVLVLLHCLSRNHWSLFPAVFGGRGLPSGVYDELMGILMHGCVGESNGPKLEFQRKRPTFVR